MKAITLTQPFATLVAIGAKRIETRSWRTPYRGPLAIHAAKGFPEEAQRLVLDGWSFFEALNPGHSKLLRDAGVRLVPSEVGRRALGQLPLGCVIATCRLVSCFSTDRIEVGTSLGVIGDCGGEVTEQEYAFGNYDPGRWAWLLADVKRLAEPIPAKGMLGLWEWNPGVVSDAPEQGIPSQGSGGEEPRG